ncbi:hypothetical protein TYRP_018696 [Tyrophagus putrescentiae]|nr:hypothetical protein TYRP_018696 [Tyrophagus putrescentiae]
MENDSVFHFLDDMFYSGNSTSASMSSSFTSGSSKKPKAKSQPSRNQTKNIDAKLLVLSAFKVDEELKKAEAELRRYEESLRRNFKGTSNGKSAEVQGDLGLKTIQQKLDRARAIVDGLKRRQAELGRETTLRKDKQKMVF